MKKLSILGFGTLAFLCACNPTPSNKYTINGTTDLADGEVIYMTYVVEDSLINDSSIVANGQFSFAGSIDIPQIAYLVNGKQSYNNAKTRSFVIEPGQLSIVLNGEDYTSAEVTGSSLTIQMDSLQKEKAALYEQMNTLRQQFMEAQGDTAKLAEIEKQAVELSNQIQDVQVNFVKTHPASLYTPHVLYAIKGNLPFEELKEIFSSLNPEVQAADPKTAKFIEALESIMPGGKAPEITGKDQNGKDVSLSGLKGKVVLVDFWATWCGPCRASLPHVKELYEKYNDKGLEVLAVSLDRSEEPWKEFIATSGMGMEKYHNVYDGPVNNADNYAIQYIPSKFIVDAEGNMVGRFDDEAELDAKLAELLDK